jgi:uncharacterized protein (TIGR00255 family)
MTGFGYAEKVTDEFSLMIEIKSYNNRYLELEIKLPPVLSKLEERIRQFFSSRVARGRIELFVRLREFAEAVEVIVNKEAVKAHMKALETILQTAELDEPIHLAHLLRLEGVIKSYSTNNVEKYWEAFEPLLAEAFLKLEQARSIEGKNIEQTIFTLINSFEGELGKIKNQEPVYKDKLTVYVREKFREMLGSEIDESRVLQEIAVLLLKSDIHEEIIRLQSHLKSIREAVGKEAVVGKKLDFLCQELNREVNTIGSKSFVYEINSAVIACKEIIERMRELLRNVE